MNYVQNYINSTTLHLLSLPHEQMEKVIKRTNNGLLLLDYNTQTSMKEIHTYTQLYSRCLFEEGDHESVVEATVISSTVKGPDTCIINVYMYMYIHVAVHVYVYKKTRTSTCTCICTCM